jgi:pimeloyl-ACP methyl ester carboxylesterase
MKTWMRALTCVAILCGAMLLPAPARAQGAIPGDCTRGVLPSGALSLICVPASGWNGEVVVFAHGYVAAFLPPAAYEAQLTLPDRTYLPTLLQTLGYAFIATSYRQNGLAILEGADDIRELIAAFKGTHPETGRVFLTGVSEGGLVATLLAERSPDLFPGGGALATCGPIGSFLGQIQYVGDFRVLFDYFFPGLIPGSPISIPLEVIANWQRQYVPAITAALAANPSKAVELLRVAKAPFDPAQPATVVATAIDLLTSNVIATNDAALKLGGSPFGNRTKWYFGSRNDFRLNRLVQRFTASPAARLAVREYETNGELSIPLVTLHTIGDDLIPIWHEVLYVAKADTMGRGRLLPLPVFRYGHCTFTTNEIVGAFLLMVRQP